MSGGWPAGGVFTWPAVFDHAAYAANHVGDVTDGRIDFLDCGKDSYAAHMLTEAAEHPIMGPTAFDSVVNRDFASPAGTDTAGLP